MIDTSGGMIVGLLNQVDTISEQFVLNGYQRMVDNYATAIYSMVTLSVIVYGYAALQGWVNMSLAETGKRLLVCGFVLAFALNWGTFSTYTYDFFTNAPNEISNVLIKSISHSTYSDAQGVNGALQRAWEDGKGFWTAIWDRGGLNNIFPYVWATVLFIAVIFLVGIALIELVVAKFGLAIYLVLAPLIIPTFLFKSTREILFDGWLKHLVGFAMVPVFVTAALALGLALLSDSVGSIQQAINTDTVTIGNTCPYLIFVIVCIGLVIKAAHMAASIAGGISAAMAPFVANSAKSIAHQIQDFLPKIPLPKNGLPNSPVPQSNPSRPTNPSVMPTNR